MIAIVHLFAQARQTAGSDSLEVEIPSEASVEDLCKAICAACPPLTDLLPHCHIAIDEEYADDTMQIEEGANIALIPPVSGG